MKQGASIYFDLFGKSIAAFEFTLTFAMRQLTALREVSGMR
jgi:hypothetical protein